MCQIKFHQIPFLTAEKSLFIMWSANYLCSTLFLLLFAIICITFECGFDKLAFCFYGVIAKYTVHVLWIFIPVHDGPFTFIYLFATKKTITINNVSHIYS